MTLVLTAQPVVAARGSTEEMGTCASSAGKLDTCAKRAGEIETCANSTGEFYRKV